MSLFLYWRTLTYSTSFPPFALCFIAKGTAQECRSQQCQGYCMYWWEGHVFSLVLWGITHCWEHFHVAVSSWECQILHLLASQARSGEVSSKPCICSVTITLFLSKHQGNGNFTGNCVAMEDLLANPPPMIYL